MLRSDLTYSLLIAATVACLLGVSVMAQGAPNPNPEVPVTAEANANTGAAPGQLTPQNRAPNRAVDVAPRSERTASMPPRVTDQYGQPIYPEPPSGHGIVKNANSSNGVIYITGGIGDEERSAMEAAQKDYNLRVTSAMKDGAFAGNTHITVRDRQGQEVINANAGPLFYASLPPGQYTLDASSEGQLRSKRVVVSNNKPATIDLRW